MTQSNLFAERVQKAFQPTTRGVVEFVDDLLGLCRLFQLRIQFRDGHCSVRRLGAESEAQVSLEIPVPKSVFRAALARIAAICNEQHIKSVTPYKGEGKIVVKPPASQDLEKLAPPSTCYVSFTNTPSEQQLEMRFASSTNGEGNRYTVLLRDKRTVTVVGERLKYISINDAGAGIYKIVSRIGGKLAVVAVFPTNEVIGVFSGDIHEPAENADKAS